MTGFWRDYAANRVALAALVLVALIVGAALLAPWIAPQDPFDLANYIRESFEIDKLRAEVASKQVRQVAPSKPAGLVASGAANEY